MSTPKPPPIRPKGNFLSANYKELLSCLIGLVLVFYVRRGVQHLDPTAAVTDFGMIDVLAFAMAAMLCTYAFLWALLRVAFKTFAFHLDQKHFRAEFERLNPNVRFSGTLAVIFLNAFLLLKFAQLFAGIR